MSCSKPSAGWPTTRNPVTTRRGPELPRGRSAYLIEMEPRHQLLALVAGVLAGLLTWLLVLKAFGVI
jgi:hypothetical protein